MIINFNKYHGAGNDFIIIDNRNGAFIPDSPDMIRVLCDRHFGVGSDGLILVNDHPEFDFEMKYFNSDGNESTMCGNGGRCVASFAQKAGITGNKAEFLASDGAHKAIISDSAISLSMRDVLPPVKIGGNNFIDTGSPHYIINVSDVEKIDVRKNGSKIRWSDEFAPNGTNVDFVQIVNGGIRVRTYERGVEDETLSCGTGVTASAISVEWEKEEGQKEVNISTHGGNLRVKFITSPKGIHDIWLTGQAQNVFNGSIDTENLNINLILNQ